MTTDSSHSEYELDEAPRTTPTPMNRTIADSLAKQRPSAAATVGGSILLVLRVALALLFLYSGIAKLFDPQELLFAVKGFEILPAEPDLLIVVSTYTVPIAEVLCAVLLLIGLWSRASALLLGVMLIVFKIAIVSVLLRGISVDCGCFGKWMPAEVSWMMLLRNLVILLPAVFIVIFGGGLFAADGRRCSLGFVDGE